MAGDSFGAIAPFYDRVMERVPYQQWADYVDLLVRHWDGSRRRVLDLACGTGTVALELARRGSEVVGVDLSAPMLAVAEAKAAAAGLSVHWVRQNMASLALAPAFDLVVCLFDSLNYLLELSELEAAFCGVRQAMVPGALFIFDVNTELALELELFTQEEMEPDAPVRLRWKSRYDRAARISTVDMEFHLDDGRVVHETHRERAYSFDELRGAVEAAGLRTLAVYDAYTFNLPRKRSDRVFYVCRT